METDIKKVINLIQEFEESFAKIVEKKRGLIPNRSLIRESEKVLRLNGSNALDIAITEELIQTLNREGLDRIRICIHERDDSVLQEMFIALANNTFIVPSLHTDKNESILLLDGLATVVFFDNWGHVTSRIPLAPYGNSLGRATYCQIIAGQVHSVIVESEYVLIKETTSGPFVPRNTFFPEWAPRFSTNEEAERYNLACLRVRTS
jgi:cupin fold WbuC family metalloprotein